jgi:hypothetical protein
MAENNMARISEMRYHCRKGNNGVGIQEPLCHWRNEKQLTGILTKHFFAVYYWSMVTNSFLCLNLNSLKNENRAIKIYIPYDTKNLKKIACIPSLLMTALILIQ